MSPSIPKVAIPPERWTASVYSTPEACLAKTEPGKLHSMQFDPNYWSSAYLQCIGRGTSHKECIASLPDDVRTTAGGPLTSNKELSAAIACMNETGDPSKCESHFEGLAKLGGYEEPVTKSSTQKASEFAGKAGWKLLAVPVVYYGMKFIKIK